MVFSLISKWWAQQHGRQLGYAAAASGVLLLLILPEFMNLRGHAVLLEELKTIDSTSELRRRKAEGDESATALGAGHDASWTAFLESKGLRR